MSGNKAWHILSTPNIVQLYFMFYSLVNCVILSRLEKIKWLVLGGKKALKTVLQALQCLQRRQSHSAHFESMQQPAVLPAGKDMFTTNPRTSMLSAGKSLTVCWTCFGMFSENSEFCLSSPASVRTVAHSASYAEVIHGIKSESCVYTHRLK